MEVSLVRFAECAVRIAQADLPPYRTKFSKRVFTQPQLLAILCLMRYRDWTFREAEARLCEHAELRAALGLATVPDYSTLHRFMRRLPEVRIARALEQVVQQLPAVHPDEPATVAVDSTGLTPGAVSTFYVHRVRDRHGFTWRHWLKWTVAVDVSRQAILAQLARRGPVNDCAKLRPLLRAASRQVRIGLVLADAEFDSEKNHQYVRKVLHAQSIIPAKRGKRTWHLHGVRATMRKHFPKQQYGPRSLVETVFSVVKRKLSARAPGRLVTTQRKQALLLGLAYDLYRL